MKQGKMYTNGAEQFAPETLADAVFMADGGKTLLQAVADGDLGGGAEGPPGPPGPTGPTGPKGDTGPAGADGHTPTLAEIGAAPANHTHTKANVTDFAHTHPLGELSGVTPAAIGAAPTSHTHTKANITDFPTSMPASDVSAWAKAASKPTYTNTEVGAAAAIHNHTKANITDFPASMPASDVYSWAKAASKPAYSAAEVGAAASSHSHDINSLSGVLAIADGGTGGTTRQSAYNSLGICHGYNDCSSSQGRIVTFPITFSGPPIVVACWATTGANVSGAYGALKIHSITATGFTCIAGGSVPSVLTGFHWIAIGP